MKRLHESFEETLERLLGQSPRPSLARMESGISRVWERLQSEIVDASAEIASQPVAIHRLSALAKIGSLAGIAAALVSGVELLATFVRSLRHGGPSADE